MWADLHPNQKPASEWVADSGRAKMHKDVAVTSDCYVVPAVVFAHDKRMKDTWCLATSRADSPDKSPPCAGGCALKGAWGRFSFFRLWAMHDRLVMRSRPVGIIASRKHLGIRSSIPAT
jgi:hypothetical protein